MFNEGDTGYLMLTYKLNGQDLQENAYQEMEFQINPQSEYNSIKKLLSKGDITWEAMEYQDGTQTKTFIGYVVHLNQEETFRLQKGTSYCQLRIMVGDEVGSSNISEITMGDALSTQVLNDPN